MTGRAGVGAQAEVLLVGLVTALAGLIYAGFFASWGFAPVVVGAALAPAGVVLLGERYRWRAWVVTLLLVVGLPVYAVLAAFWEETNGGLPGGAAWSALGDGLVDGWARMLTVGLPADADGELLVTPIVVGWFASAVGAQLAVRTRSALAPLAPPLVALLVALGFVAADGRSHLTTTAAFLATAFALLLVRTNRLALYARRPDTDSTGTAPPRGPGGAIGPRLLLNGPIVVVLAVVGPLVAQLLPVTGDDRFDPRDLRHEKLVIDDTLSPLVRLKPQLTTESPEELFRLEAAGIPGEVDRIRTAVLDTYDGAHWSSSAVYRVAGEELPADPADRGRRSATEVRQHVTILGLPGPFLPAIGQPTQLDADEAGFDVGSGTVVTSETGLRGYSYDVVGEVGTLAVVDEAADVADLRVPETPAFDRLRTPTPEMPQQLQNLAVLWAGDAETYTAELLALRDHLRELRYDDSGDAPPGHSYGALLRLLVGEEAEREGYAEQLATAFVVLARQRGFAARLAVGYLLPTAEPDGSYLVTEAQAHAWPEVYLVGAGWVAVEPTDVAEIDAPPPSPEEPQVEPEDVPSTEGPVEAATEPRVIVGEADQSVSGVARVRDAAAAGGLALLALVLLAPVLTVVAKRWRRARRRRARGRTTRVMGAWHETVDRLREQGVPVHRADTAEQVSQQAVARFNGKAGAVEGLVPLVGVAVFAPFEPSEEAVGRAWQLERTARRQIRPAAGWRRQVQAIVDPRPLVSRLRR